MADLFKDIIPSILQTKKNVLEDEKDYNAFIVNKALSFHKDCLMHANQMNIHHVLDNKLQYQYLINTIRPYHRKYQGWLKAEKVENLECVKEYYGYSNEKAKAALEVLSEEQLITIKKELNKGGINGKSQRVGGGEAKKSG
jgi:hypothetical protein